MGSSTGRAGSVASWMSAFEFPFRPATAQVVLKKTARNMHSFQSAILLQIEMNVFHHIYVSIHI